jgi:glycerol kinase
LRHRRAAGTTTSRVVRSGRLTEPYRDGPKAIAAVVHPRDAFGDDPPVRPVSSLCRRRGVETNPKAACVHRQKFLLELLRGDSLGTPEARAVAIGNVVATTHLWACARGRAIYGWFALPVLARRTGSLCIRSHPRARRRSPELALGSVGVACRCARTDDPRGGIVLVM